MARTEKDIEESILQCAEQLRAMGSSDPFAVIGATLDDLFIQKLADHTYQRYRDFSAKEILTARQKIQNKAKSKK